MEVTNKTSFDVIAFCHHTQFGYGLDILIKPAETKKVPGVYIGEMAGGKCFISPEVPITCHDGPDDGIGFHVSLGQQLCLSAGELGVTIRHSAEGRKGVIIHVG